MCRSFNIRVYGLLFNANGEVLLTDEDRFGKQFTKFPGGGLEFGEGMRDCLIREFKEEIAIDITVGDHVYTTDFFQPSGFDPNDQLISVYFKVNTYQIKDIPIEKERFNFQGKTQIFRWKKWSELREGMLDFPVDQYLIDNLDISNSGI